MFRKKTRAALRPLTPADVPRALDIIRRFSEDDYQVARHTLRRDLDLQFALEVAGEVAGVTGARFIEGTEDAYWLSWTYLHDAWRGQGLGQAMLEEIFETLRRLGGRKIFLTTSDLRDGPEGPMIYGPAIKAYGRAGFEEEARHRAYYTPSEGQIVMGRRLRKPRRGPPGQDTRGATLTDADEIIETDDAWFLDWRFAGPAAEVDVAAVQARVREIHRDEGARVVFVGVPSDAPAVERLFREAGFGDDGRLRDFYADGVDELRLRLDLE